MAIEIRIESSWDTADGEGRTIEVTVVERSSPWEDPVADSRWFAGGDLEALKRYLAEIIDRKAEAFLGRDRWECMACGRVVAGEPPPPERRCARCRERCEP